MPLKSVWPLAATAMAAPSLALAEPAPVTPAPEAVVRAFFREVRSGAHPERAALYMAPRVVAHQVASEGLADVVRTPREYALHVREFLDLFGEFDLEIVETLAAEDKVFVRWIQRGRHLASLDGEAPTGAPLVDIASAVYRVRGGRIVEYWIQADRKGLEIQVQRAAARGRP